jgi:WD40 repeat protein
MQILTGPKMAVAALAFSPDGRYLAAGADGAQGVDRAVLLWDLGAGPDPLWSALHRLIDPRAFCFAPDGMSLIGRSYDGTVRRYDARTGIPTDAPRAEFDPLLFSPDGRFATSWVRVSSEVEKLRCGRLTPDGQWTEVWCAKLPPRDPERWGVFWKFVFSSDSRRLAFVFECGPYRRAQEIGVVVFAVESGAPLARWEGALPRTWGGAVSPVGAVVLLHDSVLYALDANDPNARPVKRVSTSTRDFTSATFSQDGTQLATTCHDTAATLWDPTTWEVRKRYEWQIGRLRTAAFAPDGLRCAVGSDTGQVVVWDLDD